MKTTFAITGESHSIGEKRSYSVHTRRIAASSFVLLALATGIYSFTKIDREQELTNPAPGTSSSTLRESGELSSGSGIAEKFAASSKLLGTPGEFDHTDSGTSRPADEGKGVEIRSPGHWATLDLNKAISLGSSISRGLEPVRRFTP